MGLELDSDRVIDLTDPDPVLAVAEDPPRRRRWLRRTVLGAAAVFSLLVLYVGVTFVQVWWASRHDSHHQADAIVVLGAAQFNGRPSKVLQARLDHALELYQAGLAPYIVVTGGKQPGDVFTEAATGAKYLATHGVPETAILREVQGSASFDSLAAAARILKARGFDEVLLVSDPYHSYRIAEIASELGLKAHVSPTHTSPINGVSELRAMVRETAAVSIGRVIGYGRLFRLEGS